MTTHEMAKMLLSGPETWLAGERDPEAQSDEADAITTHDKELNGAVDRLAAYANKGGCVGPLVAMPNNEVIIKPTGKGVRFTPSLSGEKWDVEFYGLKVDSFSPLGSLELPAQVEELVESGGKWLRTLERDHRQLRDDHDQLRSVVFDVLKSGALWPVNFACRHEWTAVDPTALRRLEQVYAGEENPESLTADGAMDHATPDKPTVDPAEHYIRRYDRLAGATRRLLTWARATGPWAQKTIDDVKAVLDGTEPTSCEQDDVFAEKDRTIKDWQASYCRAMNEQADLIRTTVAVANAADERTAKAEATAGEQAEVIRQQGASNEGLRQEVSALRSANEEVNGRVAKQIAKVNERDATIGLLRAEVHTMVDTSNDLAGQLSEARHEATEWKAALVRLNTKFEQAAARYQELAEAVQPLAERWQPNGVFTISGVSSDVCRLAKVLARHAHPADFNTDDPATPKKPGSISVTLDTSGIEQRAREMGEAMVAERLEPILKAVDELLASEKPNRPEGVMPKPTHTLVSRRALGYLKRAAIGKCDGPVCDCPD